MGAFPRQPDLIIRAPLLPNRGGELLHVSGIEPGGLQIIITERLVVCLAATMNGVDASEPEAFGQEIVLLSLGCSRWITTCGTMLDQLRQVGVQSSLQEAPDRVEPVAVDGVEEEETLEVIGDREHAAGLPAWDGLARRRCLGPGDHLPDRLASPAPTR